MGGEQASNVLLTIKIKAFAKKGIKMSSEDQEKFRKPTLEKYEYESSPYFSSSRLWDDGIIDPTDTRAALGLGIAMSLNAPIPDQRYGVFRM
jgi:3-methylcrotonyl-CoA carboxylase beta subunit